MNNLKVIKRSIINGLAVFAYIVFIVWFLNNISLWFGEDDRGILAPVLILSIFVISALITSGLVLGKPIVLYLDGKKREAIHMIFYTGLTLFFIISSIFIIISLIK